MDFGAAMLIGILLILFTASGAVIFFLYTRLMRLRAPSASTGLAYMRSIGQLSVFKVITKEKEAELE